MKRVVWMLCLVMVGVIARAQDVETSTSTNDTISILSIDVPVMKLDTAALYIEAIRLIDSLTVANDILKNTIDTLRSDSSNLQEHILSADKSLISLASSHLYFPYTAYCVKKMAIPGFEKVYSEELKEKYSIRLLLLKNYQSHVESMVAFLNNIGTKLKNPFVKSGNEFIESLKGQTFYMDYMGLEDYEETYLGSKIKLVIQRLEQHGYSYKASFDDIIEELENCLKTEIDL